MGKLKDLLWTIPCIAIGPLFTHCGKEGYYGSREEIAYQFMHRERPAQVIRTRLNLAPDTYHFQIGESRALGTFIADNGDVIETKHSFFDASMEAEGNYSVNGVIKGN